MLRRDRSADAPMDIIVVVICLQQLPRTDCVVPCPVLEARNRAVTFLISFHPNHLNSPCTSTLYPLLLYPLPSNLHYYEQWKT
jgi:hypothetical protein